MNKTVVLPPFLFSRLIDTAVTWTEGDAGSQQAFLAGAACVGAMALCQAARLVKLWGLRMGNQGIAASARADALRGVRG